MGRIPHTGGYDPASNHDRPQDYYKENLLGSVLEVEITAQTKYLTYVKTKACGFHSAMYLHI